MFILLSSSPNGTALLIVALAISLALSIVIGVLPPRKVNGPLRIPSERSAWPLVAVLCWAGGIYVLAGALYQEYRLRALVKAAGHPVKFSPSLFSTTDTALMFALPPLIGLLALLWGGRAVRATAGQDLGLDARRIPAGLARGIVGIAVIFPSLLLLNRLVEYLYEHFRYAHEPEHPLLKALSNKPEPLVLATAIVGACIIAPLFEELLFRGFLQTLLRRMFVLATSPTPAAPPRLLTLHTWAAVVITSVAFAGVHPPWSRPVIFALSVCLGYAYERTRNLWVSITMHALFNGISTAWFLYRQSHPLL